MKPPRCFLELPAGLASVSLRLHGGPGCRPPISRMGNKAGYAEAILWTLGLTAGRGADRYLWAEADDDVAALLRCYPDATMLRAVADIIRGWKDEEPRALWERLRARTQIDTVRANWTTEQRDKAIGCDRTADRFDGMARDVAANGILGQWSYRRGVPESGFNAGLLADREPTPTAGEHVRPAAGGMSDDTCTYPLELGGWEIWFHLFEARTKRMRARSRCLDRPGECEVPTTNPEVCDRCEP